MECCCWPPQFLPLQNLSLIQSLMCFQLPYRLPFWQCTSSSSTCIFLDLAKGETYFSLFSVGKKLNGMIPQCSSSPPVILNFKKRKTKENSILSRPLKKKKVDIFAVDIFLLFLSVTFDVSLAKQNKKKDYFFCCFCFFLKRVAFIFFLCIVERKFGPVKFPRLSL